MIMKSLKRCLWNYIPDIKRIRMEEENSTIEKKERTTCCRSCSVPKGRCYDCPEDTIIDPDEEKI